MTAESFADLLKARRAGSGKWTARCPAHDDRNPSLSIRQGNRGVLIKCMSAGCTAQQIVAAMGLRMADLFDGPSASPEKAAQLTVERQAASAIERQRHLRDREQRNELYRLECLRNLLGAKLARFPDDAEIGRLFHSVCDRIAEAMPPQHEDGSCRIEPTPETAPWIADALKDISRSFAPNNEKAARMAA